MTRTVLVYNTVGKNHVSIETDAPIWRPLTEELTALAIPYKNMRVIVAETQCTLDSAEALLPTGNFTLMIFPKHVESGNEPDEIVPDDDEFEVEDEEGEELVAADALIDAQFGGTLHGIILELDIIIDKASKLKEKIHGLVDEMLDPKAHELHELANDIQRNLVH